MYAKLFASLYQGTLRGRPDEILVFTNLLAHTSADGVVDKHFRAIADETGLPVDRVKAAILALEAPDEESRSPEENGSRIVRMDDHRVWGWRIVNHAKYRSIRNEEDRAAQNRESQRKWRERDKAKKNAGSNEEVIKVSRVSQNKPKQKQEAEAEAEAETHTPHGVRESDFSEEGNPVMIERIIKAYPKNGKEMDARRHLADLASQGFDLHDILEKVKVHAKCITDLPEYCRRFCPGKHTYFEQRNFNDDPRISPWVFAEEPKAGAKPRFDTGRGKC